MIALIAILKHQKNNNDRPYFICLATCMLDVQQPHVGLVHFFVDSLDMISQKVQYAVA